MTMVRDARTQKTGGGTLQQELRYGGCRDITADAGDGEGSIP